MKRTHKDIRYKVNGERFRTFQAAAAFAVIEAYACDEDRNVETYIKSAAGARWLLGKDGPKLFRRTPAGSPVEIVTITAQREFPGRE